MDVLETCREDDLEIQVMNLSEMNKMLKHSPMASQVRKLKERCMKINKPKEKKMEEKKQENKKGRRKRKSKKSNNADNRKEKKKEEKPKLEEQTVQILIKFDLIIRIDPKLKKVQEMNRPERNLIETAKTREI